jgi:hypothetical protein
MHESCSTPMEKIMRIKKYTYTHILFLCPHISTCVVFTLTYLQIDQQNAVWPHILSLLQFRASLIHYEPSFGLKKSNQLHMQSTYLYTPFLQAIIYSLWIIFGLVVKNLVLAELILIKIELKIKWFMFAWFDIFI